MPEIRTLLVANRGEIAARIFRTAGRLGMETVAVYAPDDEGALHTREAGRAEPVASYLDPAEVVAAAGRAGADAVHPGYGFLAESPVLAEAVTEAGLTWVGPPPDVLRSAGDKLEAKRIAAEAGVPVLETGTPDEVGYPLIVKAAAGGGGRGMRVVREPAELDAAVEAAKREALAGFGDDTVFFERYVERPRHVEIQLLADAHGNAISLGERDCSVQRRHQKVLEESPSPAVDAELRRAMGDAAVALAEALRYEGAGTAEFILGEDGRFAFLELNARIQVEHPVTELVTGVDLVEQQLLVAAGEAVTLKAGDPEGHAVEARLYAEHPLTFLPQAGTIVALELPEGVRVDAGVAAGDEVPVAYDPMIAKLVAHGETRDEALGRLAEALAATHVGGVTTNLPFLRWLVGHPAFRAGEATTAFLTEHPPLSRYPRVPRVWRSYWRVNRDPALPAPAPQAPPVLETAAHGAPGGEAERKVIAPMPGTVIRVLAAEGDRVEARQPLVVVEAMKMETPLLSPFDATVKGVNVAEGDRVTAGMVLVELEE